MNCDVAEFEGLHGGLINRCRADEGCHVLSVPLGRECGIEVMGRTKVPASSKPFTMEMPVLPVAPMTKTLVFVGEDMLSNVESVLD